MVKVLPRLDRNSRIEVVPSQDPGVRARFPWIPPQAYEDALQLIGPDGRTWQGAVAIEQLLGILPKGKLIAWIFAIPFARRMADRFYRWFARNRYRLDCGEHCRSRIP
jgi:predicted DCC family thiol-disulfide oxidoreductase YuxK